MSSRLALTAIAVSALTLFATGVSASPITKTINFSASNFYDVLGNSPTPFDPVVGSVTLTFDPAAPPVSNVTTGITLNSLNMPLDSPIAFSTNFDAISGVNDILFIGGLHGGANGALAGEYDFLLSLLELSTAAPRVGDLYYKVANKLPDIFFSRKQQVTIVSGKTTSPCPEPATWTTMILGFGMLGAITRRRRAVA